MESRSLAPGSGNRLPVKSFSLLSAICLFAIGSVRADGPASYCGTSPENNLRLERLHASAAQSRSSAIHSEAVLSTADIRFQNGVFIVAESPAVIINKHPLDLVGGTLSAKRLNDESFALTKGPLAFHPPAGNPKATLSQSSPAYQFNLTSFSFPFGAKQFRKLYISSNGGIFFQEPPPAGTYPFPSEKYVAGRPIAVIAPLLMGGWSFRSASTKIFVEETFGEVAITWRFTGYRVGAVETPDIEDLPFAGDAQAILKANGNIDFSYPSFSRFLGGAPVLTTGEEASRNLRTVLGSGTDPALDIAAGNPESLDLRTIEVDRQTALDRLEIRATVGKPIDLTASGYQVDLNISGFTDKHSQLIQTYPFNLAKGGPPVAFASDPNAFAVVISGTSISASLAEAWLPGGNYTFTISTRNAAGEVVDSVSASAKTLSVAPGTETDFSVASELHMPVAEAFTVGTLDPIAVWNALSARYGLSPEDVDGVAMYTTSPTDIDYFAFAYATQGISGVDGNGQCSCDRPRFPNLMHMGMAEHKGPLLHELGHRWVFYPEPKDIFKDRWINFGGHPTWGVDMAAAFVNGGSSPMGGAGFFDRGKGNYEAHCGNVGEPDGFSWLELYLMGLARPEEVKPVNDFGPSPGTGCNYVGPMTIANRLTIEYIIEANGLVTPSFDKSRKRFPVAFVLIESPDSASATFLSNITRYAAGFAAEFHTATGGRGEVTIIAPASRQRAVHR